MRNTTSANKTKTTHDTSNHEHYGDNRAFDDGYYQIQQMNNQLINSQRALLKKNQQLNSLLREIRDANNLISLLEHDELTGLLSASAFYQQAQNCLEQNADSDYEVIIINLAQFKLVNETCNREAGDKLLKTLALFLTGLNTTDQGLVSRITADVFYLFFPTSLHISGQLKESISSFLERYPLPLHLHARIGVYSTTFERVPVENMCDRALFAIDSITDATDTEIAFYDQKMHDQLLLEALILDHVHEAVENHEFQLYLQPKVDILTRQLIGAEALVRWQHPTLGWITPDRFIPLLEKNGYIYEVDQYIWREACKILATLKSDFDFSIPISVNAARGDLYQKDFLQVLQNLISDYQLEPSNLRIEIIERNYVRDASNICQILSDLRSVGFDIEMDDFGTGESSLSMIADMPIDYIKLDRTFLASGLQSRRHTEIIRLIINLTRTLDMGVIAEGVETQEQADLLSQLGCNYAQGYFYDRPMPADEFLKKFSKSKFL